MTRPADDWFTCECGKRAYFDKHAARRTRGRMATHALHMYRCATTGHWHLGHQAPGLTRDDYRTLARGATT